VLLIKSRFSTTRKDHGLTTYIEPFVLNQRRTLS